MDDQQRETRLIDLTDGGSPDAMVDITRHVEGTDDGGMHVTFVVGDTQLAVTYHIPCGLYVPDLGALLQVSGQLLHETLHEFGEFQ